MKLTKEQRTRLTSALVKIKQEAKALDPNLKGEALNEWVVTFIEGGAIKLSMLAERAIIDRCIQQDIASMAKAFKKKRK